MPKIISRIRGGLGNQLFCYAAARRLAITTRSELVIDDISGFKRDLRYRRHYELDCFNIRARKATPSERMEPFERARRGFAQAVANWKPFSERSYIKQEGDAFDQRLLHVCPTSTVVLDGLWQSENYFWDVRADIRNDLLMEAPTDIITQKLAETMEKCTSVALHIRCLVLRYLVWVVV